MKATSHLASSLRRNFGTRSLNRENFEMAYHLRLQKNATSKLKANNNLQL